MNAAPAASVLVGLALVVLGGCGNLTAGGASEVEVVVASDEGSTAQAVHAVPAEGSTSSGVEAFAGQATPPVLGQLAGQVSVTFSLSLLDGEGGEVALVDGPQDVELSLVAGTRVEVARTSVPPGEYEGFRATFTRVEANVTEWPGNLPLPSMITVDLSDGPLVVQRGPGLSLGTGDRVRVVLDLGTGAWLVAADPSNGRVARGVLQNAIRLEVESVG